MIAVWIHGLQTGWALAVEWVERDPQPILQESGKLLASDVETQSLCNIFIRSETDIKILGCKIFTYVWFGQQRSSKMSVTEHL